MHFRFIIYALVCLWIALPALAVAAPSGKATMDDIVETIKLEQQGLQHGSDWELEEAALLDEIRQETLEQAWYAAQVKTFKGYNSSAKGRILELESKRDKLEKIEAGLAGELVANVEQFTALVNADLPFLPSERSRRVKFLQQTVADYDLDGAEKLRRVLEGMQVELGYGKNVDLTEGVIDVNGGQQLVQYLRIGRLALYAIAVTGEQVWTWEQGVGYRLLAADDAIIVKQAAAMVTNNSISSLANLPITTQIGSK